MKIKGKLSLVPTLSVKLTSFYLEEQNKRREFLGLEKLTSEDEVVQINIKDDTSNSWQYHGKEIDGFEYSCFIDKLWPMYTTKKALKDLKENKSIVLKLRNNVEVELIAKQHESRYSFGTFEEVLESL